MYLMGKDFNSVLEKVLLCMIDGTELISQSRVYLSLTLVRLR